MYFKLLFKTSSNSITSESNAQTLSEIKRSIENEINALMLKIPHSQSKTGYNFPPVKSLPDNQKLRILVTGGSGFVGSHLVDRLMMAGHQVIVVDNMFTGWFMLLLFVHAHQHGSMILYSPTQSYQDDKRTSLSGLATTTSSSLSTTWWSPSCSRWIRSTTWPALPLHLTTHFLRL